MDPNMDVVDFGDGEDARGAVITSPQAGAVRSRRNESKVRDSRRRSPGDRVHFLDSDEEDLITRRTERLRQDQSVKPTRRRTAGKKSVVVNNITKKTAGKKSATGSDRVSHLRAFPHDEDGDPLPISSTSPTAAEHIPNPSESPLFEPSIASEDLNEALEDEYGLDSTSEDLIRNHNMDGLKRARAIKAEIKDNISVLLPQDKKTSTRRNVEEDPENIIIKKLRTEQNMSWKDIANFLNQERRDKGEAANFTEPAVYGRFIRSAPRVATSVGEIGFDPKDYMHLRHPNQYTNGKGTGTISKAGKKRVKNYDNATELKANVRQRVSSEEHDELKTAEKSEQLMQAVAVIERNFWSLVADEMERATTMLYEPDELASRYHSI